jgi:hypothetical protein
LANSIFDNNLFYREDTNFLAFKHWSESLKDAIVIEAQTNNELYVETKDTLRFKHWTSTLLAQRQPVVGAAPMAV